MRVGISGWRYAPWRYAPWRGKFYPPGLKQKNELHFASRKMKTIEINGSFYSTQSAESYQRWHRETPPDFQFSIKGPRYVTHYRRLTKAEAPLGNFFASGVLHLEAKLGPILWQLPPNFRYDPEPLQDFFHNLPKTVGEAIDVTRHADRVTPSYPKGAAGSPASLRHALEVRHHSFENPDFIALLKRYHVALVFADTAGKWPYMEDVTSDFIYVRLHGEKEIYSSGYGDSSLRFWARRIRAWRAGRQARDALTMADQSPPCAPRDVYVYFDNDVKVRAPFDAQRLAKMVTPADPVSA